MLNTSRYRPLAGKVAYTILFLFLFQLITAFVEAIYAFGLLGTSIPPEIVSVLLFFSPVVLLLAPRLLAQRAVSRGAQGALFPLALIVIACRLLAVMLDTRGRMLMSGVGVGAALIWLPLVLRGLGRDTEQPGTGDLTGSLLTAVMLSVVLRVAGSGLDPSTRGPFQLAGWLLAAMALAALVLLRRAPDPVPADPGAESPGVTVSFGRLLAWVLGVNSVLILLYYAFISPGVMARWTGADYPAIVMVLVLALAGFAAMGAFRRDWLAGAGAPVLWALNGAFVLAFASTLLIHQLRFPVDPGAYPFYAPNVSRLATFPLVAMLLLSPVIFVDFALYLRAFATARPSLRALGGAFTLGSLYWVIMIFAHVFTTVYDYIPVAGPAFRDRFWLVHLIVGLGLVLPLISVRKGDLPWKISRAWASLVALLGVVAVVGVFVTQARPASPPPQSTLTVLTYNVQQGYREDGQYGAGDQLALMREVNADLIGLQESDTTRIAGGNTDIVRYYADALDMHAYYGPTTVDGTFGIALLSRYPLENPRTFYMYSVGEQTATIEAQITVGQEAFNVFVTHLGNGGPLVQQEAIMSIVAGRANVILMGDFNFRPDTGQYALTTRVLDDAWLRRWPGGVEDGGVTPNKRIDHIFISPSLEVEDSRFIDSPASDHPAVTAILRLE